MGGGGGTLGVPLHGEPGRSRERGLRWGSPDSGCGGRERLVVSLWLHYSGSLVKLHLVLGFLRAHFCNNHGASSTVGGGAQEKEPRSPPAAALVYGGDCSQQVVCTVLPLVPPSTPILLISPCWFGLCGFSPFALTRTAGHGLENERAGWGATLRDSSLIIAPSLKPYLNWF